MAAEISKKSEGGTITYLISGYLDEQVSFPIPAVSPTITINLGKVTGLNSVATKGWCTWIGAMHSSKGTVLLEECPMIFVKSFNVVNGVLAPNTKVVSFYVPFVSDVTGARKDVLFTRGQEFDDAGNVKMPKVTDDQGGLMEADVIPEYFRFLKRV